MLTATRIYRNASAQDLRVDTIVMVRKGHVLVKDASEHTFSRDLRPLYLHNSGVADRVVAEIEIVGNFNDLEASTGNYLWATWNSPSARLNMSDLPIIGSTV